MELIKLTQQFGKKNVPEVRPGDTVRVSYKITEAGKTRVQAFEGVCLATKHGRTLDASFTLRKISGGVGVERTFPLHSPLITKLEKVKSRRVRRAKLYFLRDLVGKKAKKVSEKKDYQLWEEAFSEEELARIEQEKEARAAKKAEEKAKKKDELEKKFEKAVVSHKEAVVDKEK